MQTGLVSANGIEPSLFGASGQRVHPNRDTCTLSAQYLPRRDLVPPIFLMRPLRYYISGSRLVRSILLRSAVPVAKRWWNANLIRDLAPTFSPDHQAIRVICRLVDDHRATRSFIRPNAVHCGKRHWAFR